MNKQDFRIVEYDGKFEIQRKFIKETITGMWWWKKTFKSDVWKVVDKFGRQILYSRRLGLILGTRIKLFKSLEKAEQTIDIMIEGTKYHYLK